jgi:SH3-like domain-containing protein
MRSITVFLTAIFLLLPSPGFSEYPRSDTVKAAMGNIREKPSTDARIIQRVYRGDTVTIHRLEGEWLYVKLPEDTAGWAHRILFDIPTPSPPLKPDDDNNNPAFSATIREFGANVRAAPSRKAKIVYYLRRGDTVRILDKTENWLRVEYEGKKTGWMHKSLFSPPRKEAVTENKIAQEIKSIQTVIFSETEEKVLFTLSGFFPPKTSTLSGDNPKVVCDFPGVQPADGVSDKTAANGKFIREIEIDVNDSGTQISVSLSPDFDYDIEQVFYEEEKIYILIFRKM